MTLGKPKVGSKEGPSQEAVDAAIKRKQGGVLSMAEWWAMCTGVGALFAGVEEVQGGTVVALKGVRDGKAVESHAHCPTGQPLQLTAAMVLENFRNAKGGESVHEIPTEPPPPSEADARGEEPLPQLPPDVPTITSPGFADTPRDEGGSDSDAQPIPYMPTVLTDKEKRDTSGPYTDDAITKARAAAGLPPLTAGMSEGGGRGMAKIFSTPGAPTSFKQHASMIKRQDGTPQHRHEPGKLPPGAAGMCQQCNVQPVQHPGSMFCGARCAQDYHTSILTKRQDVNLPRYK